MNTQLGTVPPVSHLVSLMHFFQPDHSVNKVHYHGEEFEARLSEATTNKTSALKVQPSSSLLCLAQKAGWGGWTLPET